MSRLFLWSHTIFEMLQYLNCNGILTYKLHRFSMFLRLQCLFSRLMGDSTFRFAQVMTNYFDVGHNKL